MGYISKEEMIMNFMQPVFANALKDEKYSRLAKHIKNVKELHELDLSDIKVLSELVDTAIVTYMKDVSAVIRKTKNAFSVIQKAACYDEAKKMMPTVEVKDSSIGCVQQCSTRKPVTYKKGIKRPRNTEFINMVMEYEHRRFSELKREYLESDIHRIRILIPNTGEVYTNVPVGYFICSKSLSRKDKERIKSLARTTYINKISDRFDQELQLFETTYGRQYEPCISTIMISKKQK